MTINIVNKKDFDEANALLTVNERLIQKLTAEYSSFW